MTSATRITDLRLREIEQARQAHRLFSVHYACESFYDAKDHPPAIACISIAQFLSGGDFTFAVTDRPDDGEKHLLRRYFGFLKENGDASFLHWNRNSSDFGFDAIEKRYEYLDLGEPLRLPPHKRYDVDDLVTERYGTGYADHPKLHHLGRLNGFNFRHFRSGKEESEAYKTGDWATIRRSTMEKAWLISTLTQRILDGTLETRHGGRRLRFAESMMDSIQTVLTIGARFQDVVRQLRRRGRSRPPYEITDEYDVQDLFHALLRLFFEDIRPEEWTPSYAGSASRMDFLVPDYGLAIELKRTRPSLGSAEVGKQLSEDIAKYAKHPEVRHLVCLVFDEDGHVANPRGIEHDLTRPAGNMMVTVRIYDR